MTYIIYADVMIIWNTFINVVVLILSSKILNRKIRYRRLLCCSILTSLVMEIIYICTIHTNIYIHHILYAIAYVFMTIFYFNIQTIKELIVIFISIFLAIIFIDGCINLIISNQIASLSKIVPIVILVLFLVSFISIYRKKEERTRNHKYDLIVFVNSKKLNLSGYLDTGNTLVDPYTKSPVIILDYTITKKIFDDKIYNLILNYHNTGCFDYSEAKNNCGINFYPIPYQTISTNYALMPAFKLTSLTYKHENISYEKILCGISRYKFKNTNNYQVLLNESLKPIREENSND